MRSEFLTIALAVAAIQVGSRPALEARQGDPGGPPARYRVTASFDPGARAIIGTARIEWRNPASVPATELRLLTPWNSRSDRSSWALRARAGRPAAGGPPSGPDATRLTRLTVASEHGEADRLGHTKPVAPDDANAEDRTVWAVALERPVGPGQRVELIVGWTASIPPLEAGFGMRQDVVLAAAWIPRVGVFTDDGWHAHQTNDATLPVAAFGRFDVDLQLPRGWVAGSTGVETSRREQADGSVVRRIEVETATDLAWVASPEYVERVVRVEQANGRPVDVRLLLPREHASQSERHLAAVRHTLSVCNAWFGPYPWPSLTVADVPEAVPLDERNDRSMLVASHPGIVAVTTPWILPWASGDLDRAVVEGVSNQFWTAVVAPDSVEQSWLSRGLPAFLAERVLADRYGGRFAPVRRYFNGLVTWPFAGAARVPLAGRPDDSREVRAFITLERFLGFDTVRAALGAHLVRGRFRHPTEREFLALAGSAANRDLSWFFETAMRTETRFNYAVTGVSHASADRAGVDSSVVLSRVGDGVFPVETLVTFGDGSSALDHWDGASDTRTLKYLRNTPVVRVEIDPNRILALETERLDNSWTARPMARVAGLKWSQRWAAWFHHVLLTYAFFV